MPEPDGPSPKFSVDPVANTAVVRDGQSRIHGDASEMTGIPGIGTNPQTFVDAGARAAATPAEVGQLGTQLDDGTVWRSTATTVGSWEPAKAATPTLQEVTDAGNSTTDDIAPATVNGLKLSAGLAPIIASCSAGASISPPSPLNPINRIICKPGSGEFSVTVSGAVSSWGGNLVELEMIPGATGSVLVLAASGSGPGPIHNWPCSEGSGTTAADVGSLNIPLHLNTSSWGGTSGIQLVGDESITAAAADTGMPAVTSARAGVVTFVAGTSQGEFNIMFEYGTDASGELCAIGLIPPDEKIAFTNSGGAWSSSASGFNDVTEHTIAWSIDVSSNLTFWIDGAFDSTQGVSFNTVLGGFVGAFMPGESTTALNGTVRNIQVYNRTLSNSEGIAVTASPGSSAGGVTFLPIKGSNGGMSLSTSRRSLVLADSGAGDNGWADFADGN